MAKVARAETSGGAATAAKTAGNFPLWLVVGVIFVVWAGWGCLIVYLASLPRLPALLGLPEGLDLSIAGQFGDLFGGINALATALAFAMVWWTGKLQRESLIVQQQDLSVQIEELKAQRSELEETRKVLATQSFDSKFFSQLALFREVSDGFVFSNRKGLSAFELCADESRKIIRKVWREARVNGDNFKFELDRVYKNEIYTGTESVMGPYFRTLFHLFKFVDQAPGFKYSEKVEYANLARSQMSADALTVLALNAATELGGEFTRLINNYGLLKHLPIDEDIRRVLQFYEATAIMSEAERLEHWGAPQPSH